MNPRWLRPLRWLAAAALIVAIAAVSGASNDSEDRMVPDPNRVKVEGQPVAGSVNGKYRVLLRKIHVPQDATSYGEFTDYGMYTGNSWAGYNDLPPGHWVYVRPHWYIWRDCVKPNYVVPPVPLKDGQLGKDDLPRKRILLETEDEPVQRRRIIEVPPK